MTLVPVSGALEPVEDVGAASVVDLVEGMSVGLLHRHGVAAAEITAGGGLRKSTTESLITRKSGARLRKNNGEQCNCASK